MILYNSTIIDSIELLDQPVTILLFQDILMQSILSIKHNYVSGLNLVYEIQHILNIGCIDIMVSHLDCSIHIMTQMVDIEVFTSFDMEMTIIKVQIMTIQI